METFRVHTLETAPQASRPILEEAKRRLGFVPNLYGVFAESPATLQAYTALSEALSKASLSPTEQQVVLLTASAENGCPYCVAAHTTIAGMLKVPSSVVDSVRRGTAIADGRLEALHTFALRVVQKRGWVSREELDAFLAAGFQRAHVLEVVTAIALKTISNYVNHVAETPLDDAFVPARWRAPAPATAS